ncbi:MAG: AAA family ATPase [Dehalococcoidia bacterium]
MTRTSADPTTLGRLPDRVIVSGTTGSGKTTLARELAGIMDAPYIELDALHWGPNWTPAETEVFRARVAAAVAGPRWVVDGNYADVRDLLWPRAELLVWLDYSIARVFWRLFRRTSRRVVTREELWQGNRERLRTAFFSRDSLFVWALQTHWKKRRTYPPQLREPAHAHLRVVRIRSPREMRAFMSALRSAAPP